MKGGDPTKPRGGIVEERPWDEVAEHIAALTRAFGSGEIVDSRRLHGSMNDVHILTFKDPATGLTRKGYWKPAENTRSSYYAWTTGVSGGNNADREVLFYEIDKLFGTNRVPYTTYRDFNGIPGSVMEAVEDLDVFADSDYEWQRGLVERLTAIDFTILDLLACNIDRHIGNALIDDLGILTAIDNGFTFLRDSGGDVDAMRQEITERWWQQWTDDPIPPNVRDAWLARLEDPRLEELIWNSNIGFDAKTAAMERVEWLHLKLTNRTLGEYMRDPYRRKISANDIIREAKARGGEGRVDEFGRMIKDDEPSHDPNDSRYFTPLSNEAFKREIAEAEAKAKRDAENKELIDDWVERKGWKDDKWK
jgi:hypothetical protein